MESEIAVKVDSSNKKQMINIIESVIGTKFASWYLHLMSGMALKAVRLVATEYFGRKEIDIKRNLKIQKVCLGFLFVRTGFVSAAVFCGWHELCVSPY